MSTAIYTEASPLKYEDDAMFGIEGTLSELQVSRTTVNLLEQMDENVKAKSVLAGSAAVLSGMHGIVANSAAIALYDGEETYHFAALLDDQVICGTFQHADKINDGDRVKVVVSRRGEVLFAHAIMNTKTQEFYMPMNVFSGSDGLFAHCMKVATGFTIFGWFVFLAVLLSQGMLTTSEATFEDKLILVSMMLFIPPCIMFPFEYWTYLTFRGRQGEDEESYGSAIFKVFGFSNTNEINLMRQSSLSGGENGGWYAAWRSDKLMKS